MPDIDAWTGNSFPLSDWLTTNRAVDTAILIAEDSTSVTVVRDGSELSAQTVRIDALRQPRQVETENGQVITADALVVGYRGHSTIDDTDLQPGDRFKADGRAYEIVGLLPDLENGLHAIAKIRD